MYIKLNIMYAQTHIYINSLQGFAYVIVGTS